MRQQILEPLKKHYLKQREIIETMIDQSLKT